MGIVEAITTAGSGGLIGILGSGVSGWFKVKAMKAQAEIDIQKAKLAIDKGTIEADSADFRASQEAATQEHEATIAISTIADTGPKRWLLVMLHCFKGVVRPLLAVMAHVIAAYVYFTSGPEQQDVILSQVFTMAFAYGGWYFGQRELNKRLFKE